MCAHDHSEVEIKLEFMRAVTARPADSRGDALAQAEADADESYCAAMDPEAFDPAAARAALGRLLAAFREHGLSLVRGESTDGFLMEASFRHLTVMPFTRLLAYWQEVGLSEELVIQVLELVREHRADFFDRQREGLRVLEAGHVTAEDIESLAVILESLFSKTIETVDAVYGLLTAEQKTALNQVYRDETGHS